jgi:hypothetical protein
LYQAANFQTSQTFTQGSSSGYFIGSSFGLEWTGRNFGYTAGYTFPTTGTLTSFIVSGGTSGGLWYQASNLSYDLSRSAPSATQIDSILIDALIAATETKIYGGVNNDKSFLLGNTTEIDLGGGNDTVELSQNYSAYSFQRVNGQNYSIYVGRGSWKALAKNVEVFKFADVTKTFSEILQTLP